MKDDRNHLYHRPFQRDGHIHLFDFSQRAWLIGLPDGRSHSVSRVAVAVEWPRFFDEISIDNSPTFVAGKMTELFSFWSMTDEKGYLKNLWLEGNEDQKGSRCMPIRLAEPLDLAAAEIEWLRINGRTSALRLAGKDLHPLKVPVGEKGKPQDFVIRLWAAPVRVSFSLAMNDPNLSKGAWALAMTFPGFKPSIYRFDESVDPPSLGARLDLEPDASLIGGDLGGVYRLPI